MRAMLERIPSTNLAVFVTLTDASVWLAALPFELYCRTLLAHRAAQDVGFLLTILVVNALFVGLMAAAVAATGELIRRGFTRPVRVRVPIFARDRSRRSEH